MREPTHIFFDFFGTLVSYSESRVEQGYARSHHLLRAAGSGLSYKDFLEKFDGLFLKFERRSKLSRNEFSMDSVCERFLSNAIGKSPGVDIITSFRDTYLDEWSQGVSYISGVNEMLADLADRYTLVVVSNTHHAELVRGHLRLGGIAAYFAQVITSVEHGRRKPCSSIFERALSVSHGLRETALFVGDSYEDDYKGARAMGLQSLLIDPHQRHGIPNTHRLNQILDLPSAIGRLGPGI